MSRFGSFSLVCRCHGLIWSSVIGFVGAKLAAACGVALLDSRAISKLLRLLIQFVPPSEVRLSACLTEPGCILAEPHQSGECLAEATRKQGWWEAQRETKCLVNKM